MAKATCPECNRGIKVGRRVRLGQQFLCPRCCTVVEVISVFPLALDWSDDYDEEDSEGSLEDVWSRKLGSAQTLS
jgi:hypothetical protein